MQLRNLHRIKEWQNGHRHHQPVEYHAWDLMMMLWMLGWIGWLPASVLDQAWALPLCLLGALSPDLYVLFRARWHRQRRLRCDWLPAASLPRRANTRR